MNLFKMFFAKSFFLGAEGDGAAGGSGGEGGEGSSSSDVNSDVKPETHFADDKGVPYYNRFRESSEKLEKFKDVDLELYGRAKEFDFDEAEDALNFKQKIYSDPQKLVKVLEILKGQQAAGAAKGEVNPELKAVIQELSAIKQQLAARDQGGWMKEYDSSVNGTLAESLKAEAFKDLGGKLSEFEQKAVLKLVDDVFEADTKKGRLAKLSMNDVPKVVQSVLQMVLDNRKGNVRFKKDGSPEPLKGNGNPGQPKGKPMTEEERHVSMANYLKEQTAAGIPLA